MQMISLILLSLLGIAACQQQGQMWAVLVAGSNTWDNYRHQADVCHAYQVLHNHGIPDERIIVMMYDDLAHNEQNPTPGKVINHINGPDVYKGVPRDYTKDLVTPENFMKILRGEAPLGGSGKTLNSGPNDHVFVNFVDHGAPGILAFPDGELTVKQLHKTLQEMFNKNSYKQMVWYVEACESGSMFHRHLSNKTRVYATTAANPHESSYACYFDDKLETYLGDVYSVKWMEDSDKENLESETLERQFQIVKKETNTSHVQEYGDFAIDKEVVGEFQGEKQASPVRYEQTPFDAVPSTDVPLITRYRKYNTAKTLQERSKLKAEITSMLQKRRYVKQLFDSIAQGATVDKEQAKRFLNSKLDLLDVDCHHEVVTHFSRNCLSISKNPYTTRFVQVLVNMCEERLPVQRINDVISQRCAQLPKEIQHVL